MWITTPQHDSSLVPTLSPVSSPLLLCCLFPLHYSSSCLCCFCSAPHPPSSSSFPPSVFSSPPPLLKLVSFATSLSWPVPTVRPLLSRRFPSFSATLISSASLFVSDSDDSRARPPPFLWTYGCETWLGFIYIFLALSWSLLLILLLLWNNLKQVEKRWSVAVAQDSAQEQRHS